MRYSTRTYPIEVSVLIVPSLLLLLALLIANHFLNSPLQVSALLIYVRSSLVGGHKFYLGTGVIFGFVMWHFVLLLFRLRGGKANIKTVTWSFSSLFFLMALLALPALALTIATELLYLNISPAATLKASALLMDMDKQIFGTYPIFSIQEIFSGTSWELLIIHAYLNLNVVMSAVLVALFLMNLRLFRVFLVFFSLTFAAGLAVSWLLPALGPDTVYYEPVLDVVVPADVAGTRASFAPSPLLREALSALQAMWVDPAGDRLVVTNFPSLHVAWALGAAYAAVRLARPLVLVMGPWLIFNVIGTVYTLQHYAVDILGGFLLGIIGIAAASWLINRDQHWQQTYFLLATSTQDAVGHIKQYFRL
jgi:membrane-associated phospholipid phosphatase